MNKLAKLRQQLTTQTAAAQAMLDKAKAEGDREFTDEEAAEFDELAEQIEATKSAITSAEAMAERQRVVQGVPAAGQNQVHDSNPELTHGFANMAEFASCVRAASGPAAVVDDRLQAAAASGHQGGGDSGEGYSLPPQFRSDVWELVQGFDEFNGVIEEEPSDRREVKIPTDETTPWGSSGIKAYWRAEASQMKVSDLDDEGRNVPLHALYAFTTATEELLEDSPRLASRLTRGAARAIAWKKNHAFVEGTGVGQPLGWMNSKALVTEAKEASQPAGTVFAQNVAKMYSRLIMAPGDNPFWMINSEVLPELMTMTIGDKPIWTPPTGFVDAPGGILLGRPVRISEYASGLGEKGDIQLISPAGYYAARRAQSESFATSMHLYFDRNKQAFRWNFRIGGQPFLSKPMSPAKGSATKSHFVTLAARQ